MTTCVVECGYARLSYLCVFNLTKSNGSCILKSSSLNENFDSLSFLNLLLNAKSRVCDQLPEGHKWENFREVEAFRSFRAGHLGHEALDSASEFFNLPLEEKKLLLSNDVNKPVRYGTSLNHAKDKIHFWKDFLKHFSHPLPKWIESWPSNPPSYKEKMGNYAKGFIEVIFESLGLNPNYLHKEIQESSQVMTVNCYPVCSEPELALGMPPHSDYGCIPILLESYQGLEVTDNEQRWISVPAIEGTLLVNIGDQIEVLSNGRYKSVVHHMIVDLEKRSFSIASLHSLAINTNVGPVPELVDEQHPKAYKENSFGESLQFLSANNIMKERFIETPKTNN